MSNRRTLDEKIAAAKEEAEQKQNRLKELLQQQKARERKDRTHRLCERGGKLESLLPDLVRLTEEQFESFVEKCLLTSFVRRTLAELTPHEQSNAEPDVREAGTVEIIAIESPASVARTESASTPKSTGTAHNVRANGNLKSADIA